MKETVRHCLYSGYTAFGFILVCLFIWYLGIASRSFLWEEVLHYPETSFTWKSLLHREHFPQKAASPLSQYLGAKVCHRKPCSWNNGEIWTTKINKCINICSINKWCMYWYDNILLPRHWCGFDSSTPGCWRRLHFVRSALTGSADGNFFAYLNETIFM